MAVVERARLAALTLAVEVLAAAHAALGVAEPGWRRDGGIETLVGHDAVHAEVVVVARARAPAADGAVVDVARDRNSLGSRVFSVLGERRRRWRRRRGGRVVGPETEMSSR